MISKLQQLVNAYEPKLMTYLSEHPAQILLVLLLLIVLVLIVLMGYLFLAWLLLKINKKFFRTLEKKRGKKIHLQFAESLVKVIIIAVFIVIPLAGDQISKSILGSAAVLTAVVGFAAQDVIKDILSGMLISIYKPIELGDRIELEDGTAGIVESITMRHVVLILLDTVRLVIPNSKLNTATIKNFSYDYVQRSAEFSFSVHYKSDVAEAKRVISDAIKESSYTIPGKRNKDGEEVYAPIYFMALAESALIMKTTVYFKPGTTTEVLKDDINTRVFEALTRAGIEVPYPHTNVILEQTPPEESSAQ